MHAFLSSADFFSKSTFSNILSEIPPEYYTVWIQTGKTFVWPDLGPNCLQRLSVGDISRQSVNQF